MSNVVNMSGAPLLTHRDILDRIRDRDDVQHIVMVVARTDGFFEVFYDRQAINEIVISATALNIVATDLARGTIDDA